MKIFEFLDHDKNGHVLRFECFYKEAEPEEWVVRGVVSLEEFHTAVEAAAPVKSLEAGRESEGKPSEGGLPRESLSRDVPEDLRRKWIALGYTSMRQVERTAPLAAETGT